MKPSKSNESLTFDSYTIRFLIGLIAISLPWVVKYFASRVTDSISWSYHTNARDYFVGFLFVIGAFLMSYKGHKPTLGDQDISNFWYMVSKVWSKAIAFRKWEAKHEEDLVGWVGGIAAWVTAVSPTSFCIGINCPSDPISTRHLFGAIFLFATTVYFCLFAFRRQVKNKILEDETKLGVISKFAPKKLRLISYLVCGWGILLIMAGLYIVTLKRLDTIPNVTFWAETAALELFGFAWAVASQWLPIFTDWEERQKALETWR